MRLNRDAQRRLARMAVPLMPVGGRIVFVTCHQAHFFPHKAVPKGYTAIAASKRAGETALHAMRSEFQRAGVHLTVVSGEMVDGKCAATIVDAANTPNPLGVMFARGTDSRITA
jgi:NAD(P)-dependent dehydrogenase (short-subunit alcohol dehydrogenase family)